MTAPQPPKQVLVEKLLDMGMVMVILDARRPGVAVPPNLATDPQLRLNLSYRFPTAMRIDTWGVTAVLTFGGVPFECKLPWDAVYVVFSHASGDPFVFPESVPAEAFSSVAEAVSNPPEQPEPPVRRPPSLRVITTPQNDAPQVVLDTPRPCPPEPKTPAGRGHLRVVK